MQQLSKNDKKRLKSKLIKDFARSKLPVPNSIVNVETKYGTKHLCIYVSGKYKCKDAPYSFGKYEITKWTACEN